MIVAQIRKTRAELRKGGVGGFVLMAVLALGCYFGLSGREHNLWILAAGAAPLGLTLAIPSLLDPSKSKVLTVLRERPHDVVWLYVRTLGGSQRGAFVMCGMKDGKFVQVPCVVGEEGQVLAQVAAYLPHAVAGFSPDRSARFRKSPSSFGAA